MTTQFHTISAILLGLAGLLSSRQESTRWMPTSNETNRAQSFDTPEGVRSGTPVMLSEFMRMKDSAPSLQTGTNVYRGMWIPGKVASVVEDESGWACRLVVGDNAGPELENIETSTGLYLASGLPIYLGKKGKKLVLIAGQFEQQICDYEFRETGELSLQVICCGPRWAAQARLVKGNVVYRTTIRDSGVPVEGPCAVTITESGPWAAMWQPVERKLSVWGGSRLPVNGVASQNELTIPKDERLVSNSVTFSSDGRLAYLTTSAEGSTRLYLESRVVSTAPDALVTRSQASGFVPTSGEGKFADLDALWAQQCVPDVFWVPVLNDPSGHQVDRLTPAAGLSSPDSQSWTLLIGGWPTVRASWKEDAIVNVLAMDPVSGPILVRKVNDRTSSGCYVAFGEKKSPKLRDVGSSTVFEGALYFCATRQTNGQQLQWQIRRGADDQPIWTGESLGSMIKAQSPSWEGRDQINPQFTSDGFALVNVEARAPLLLAVPLKTTAPQVLGPGRGTILEGAERGLDQVVWANETSDVYLRDKFLCNAGAQPRIDLRSAEQIIVAGGARRVTLTRAEPSKKPDGEISVCEIEAVERGRSIYNAFDGGTGRTRLVANVRGELLELAIGRDEPNGVPGEPRPVTALPIPVGLMEPLSKSIKLRMARLGENDVVARKWPLQVQLMQQESHLLLSLEGVYWQPGAQRTANVWEVPIPDVLRKGPFSGQGLETDGQASPIQPTLQGIESIHDSWAGTYRIRMPWKQIPWQVVSGSPPASEPAKRIPPGRLDRGGR